MIRHFVDAIQFAEQLIQQSTGIWNDRYGDYKVSIGDAILDRELAQLEQRRILVADYLQKITFFHHIDLRFGESEFDYLVSIGSFKIHNQAKSLCQKSGRKLVTIPAPLANDSFCTNRCNYEANAPSYKCIFPYHTIIDITILHKFPPSSNLLGLGEFVGLYTSVLDYFNVRHTRPPSILLTFIANLFRDISRTYNLYYESFLQKVAVSLVFKCIIMRINEDYQIGCGIDHLIARVLEQSLQWPHGKAVYWGTCLAIALFPEWGSFGLDWHTLISNGVDTGIISLDEMDKINKISLPFLIEAAVKTRPKRATVLTSVLKQNQRMKF